MVGANAKLDYETSPTLMVEVMARDPHGETDTIMVTIRVTDVDEAPVIMATAGGLRITEPSSRSYAENGTGDVADYSVSGANGGTATWSLTGTDGGDFNISQGGVVTFKSPPDYEGESSYMFTVNAVVNGASAERGVTVSVTNVDEDGMVSFSSSQPVVGVELTASVSDPDGGVTGESWLWARDLGQGTYEDIVGATTAAYTPVAADDGKRLRAAVTYADAESSGKEASMNTGNLVGGAASLLTRYDTINTNGEIDKLEYLAALDLFLDEDIEKPELLEVLDLHLTSLLSS